MRSTPATAIAMPCQPVSYTLVVIQLVILIMDVGTHESQLRDVDETIAVIKLNIENEKIAFIFKQTYGKYRL